MTRWLLLTAAVLAAAVCLLMLAAIGLGGPRRPAPLDSINTPFARADYSALPALRRYAARDGAALAWREYAPAAAPGNGRRVVLVHGSAGHGTSMHTLAQALAQAGFAVAALDMRGHGGSGARGQIGYIGQLEHDVEDFVRAEPHAGPQTLLGFSSGGGFALRFAASPGSALFGHYVLLAPFLHQDAPTARPVSAPWVDIGLPRLLALMALNGLGITRWNHLPVLAFAATDLPQAQLTPEYAYALALNFRPHDDYQADIRRAADRMRVVAGTDDELFDAQAYRSLFAPASVDTVPGVGHIGLILQPAGVQAAVRACRE